MDRFNLKNKVVLITGGSGFFGSQIIQALIEKKAKVINIDKKKGKEKKGNIFYYQTDILNEKKLDQTYKLIIKKFKRIDVIINNAAIDYKPIKKNKLQDNFSTTTLDRWNHEISVGLTGAFLVTKIFSKYMIKKKKGIILNIASDLSVVAPDQRLYKHLNTHKPVTYSVIKHGIVGFTKFLASYFADRNIRVNSISPGGIFNNQDKKFVKKIKQLIPLRRMAKKNEYKEIIQFLCSDASSYMTGQNIIIDGGRSII